MKATQPSLCFLTPKPEHPKAIHNPSRTDISATSHGTVTSNNVDSSSTSSLPIQKVPVVATLGPSFIAPLMLLNCPLHRRSCPATTFVIPGHFSR
ncbi:hypothetical protein CIPAW_03G165600 [Carya illinoinensis]|uniref:Uncharacterized protein n=1 Tax=Carya illinoinensis TaxID=32201 RepID=A0A8T1R5C9_CARIL|nr:hypothetical protein CIPAW_03G165600 [Carya illinoinensis]